PPSGDCDDNGVPDSQELQVDTDGDGLPDVCDQYDDDDDNPDRTDPRPRDPLCSIGPCPTANAGPDQILECTAAGAAPAQLNGSASTNPGGGALTFAWTSTVPLQNA